MQSLEDDIGLFVRLGLESLNACDQSRSGRVAVVVGHLFAHPPPERLNRHELRAVGRQMRDQDAEFAGALVYVFRTMVTGTIPADAEPLVRVRGTQVFEAVD